jgi:hypothetical protein
MSKMIGILRFGDCIVEKRQSFCSVEFFAFPFRRKKTTKAMEIEI